jgi:hypothetical protein
MSWVNIAGTDVTGAALTEVDDTNVTCTLGGTPATSLLRAVSLTFGWSGTLAVSRGGSGASTLTGVLIGNGTSAFTGVAGTASQLLRRNAGNTAYEFFSGGNLTSSNDTNIQITLGGTPTGSMINAVSLTMGWTGQLAVGRGGTGAATLTGVVIGNGTSNMTAVAGTAGQFLRRNLANTAYEFRTLQGGDIAGSELTFANDTNVTMTLGGTPASALLQPVSINLGWTGQLSVSRGGTGASTLTGVLIGNGTSAVTAITGTAGQILRRNTGNTAYEFWSANYLVNPMTLEGSIIYATTGGTPAELFANSTGTRKYLSQINGTAPTWEALPASVGGSGTTNYVSKWTASTTLGNSQIYDNGTNVGIGTSTTQTKLTTYDSANLFAASFGGASSTPNIVALGTVSSTPTINGYSYDFGLSTSLQLQSHGGNVGIGTASPSAKLHIAASGGEILRIEGGSGTTGNNYIGFRNGTTDLGFIGYGSAAANSLFLGNYQNAPIIFYTNSTTYATLTGAGNFGIGTDTPVSKLHVAGSVNISSTSYLTWGGAYGTGIPSIQGTSGSSPGFGFYAAGSTSGLTVAFNGNGSLKFYNYQSPSSFTGIAAAGLAVTSTGDLITTALSKVATEGNYTPTWTGISNVDSVTGFECRWMRIGDTLTVSGKVAINATVDNTATSASFTLPTSAGNPQAGYMNGVGTQEGGGASGSILGYGYNTGIFELLPLLDTTVNYSFIFTYRIV